MCYQGIIGSLLGDKGTIKYPNRFFGIICLANVTFATSKARIFGPYGTGQSSEEESKIALTMESIEEVEFVPTDNGQFPSDIKTK